MLRAQYILTPRKMRMGSEKGRLSRGMTISNNRISISGEKVEALRIYPVPRNFPEVKSSAKIFGVR